MIPYFAWFDFTGFFPSQENTIPEKIELKSCFPNPFNPQTTLTYSLPLAGNISLKVFDTQGREVVSLAEGWRQEGVYTSLFDGSRLASGVYLAVLRAGNSQLIQKMLLLK